MKPKTNKAKWIYTPFAAIGIVFIIVGTVSAFDTADFKKTALETTAVITDIHIHKGSDDDSDRYDVYIAFDVDGKEYSGELKHYSSGMRKGGNVQIFYAQNNPHNFRYAGMGGLLERCVFLVVWLSLCVNWHYTLTRHVQTKRFKKPPASGRQKDHGNIS